MIDKKLFGTLPTGEQVFVYTLTNKNGMEAKIINYGATIVSLTAPDKNNKFDDIVMGYDNLEDYINGKSYFGCIVGRFGNRINKGKFKLDDVEYQLTINDGVNHLHGGTTGFNKVLWEAEPITTDSSQSLKLTYHSKDGEQGYPGNLTIEVIYTLNDNNEIIIDYTATTDKPTIVNPTHHSYFNLSGSFENTILNHELFIDADYLTPVNDQLIPTGELMKVEGTPFDFKTFHKIGERINQQHQQLIFGKGYDHNWVLNNFNGKVRKVAELFEPISGRAMEVLTDQPGIQFYSGNFLNSSIKGKKGVTYDFRTGLCLETQHFPDSPNHPNFPSVVLKPGEKYTQKTIYRFLVK
ncbi:MAG: aldose epimerase family protein [Melioribacter sp.]|uniref:aldose epimerase family protein n=1 Tax=Rosettibacter primus TaxID=3111523 RepID=UPI00247ED73A|nr:aldose epimerase family protein [Melioribacter sp.]